jgi:uncharacterized protein YdhG (YjbR/CyaY superfamily)
VRDDAGSRDVDEYVAALPGDVRAALERLRRQIRSIAPEATEKLSYGMPFFFQHGRLVAFAAFKDHCSLFPCSLETVRVMRKEVAPYLSGASTLRFTPDKPLPAALVRKLVRTRLQENEENYARRLRKKA